MVRGRLGNGKRAKNEQDRTNWVCKPAWPGRPASAFAPGKARRNRISRRKYPTDGPAAIVAALRLADRYYFFLSTLRDPPPIMVTNMS